MCNHMGPRINFKRIVKVFTKLPKSQSCPHSNFLQVAINQYIFEWKNPFAFQLKDCALLHVKSLSRLGEITTFRSNSEAMRF